MTTQPQPIQAAISPDDRRVDALMLASYRLINTLEGWHTDVLASDAVLKAAVDDARRAAHALID